MLYTVLDTVRDNFINDMMTGMFQIFGTTLGDQDGDVRLITLRALGKIAEYIEIDQKDLVVSHRPVVNPSPGSTRLPCRPYDA